MTRLAVLEPTNLLGRELLDELARRGSLGGKLSLLSTHRDEVGQLADARGEATLVQRYTADELEGLDLAFFCGSIAETRPLLAALPAATTAIVLSPDASAADGQPIVMGVNAEQALTGNILLSPHPAAVLLSHLLRPLVALGLEHAAATVLLPASLHGKAGLDELFEQARALIAFSQQPREVFGRQRVFNHYPPPLPPDLAALVEGCLGSPGLLAVQAIESSVFHGVAASLYLRFAAPIDLAAASLAFAASSRFDFAVDDEAPGPVEAATRSEILLRPLAADPRDPRGLWVWAVMDNLTVGGAVNAVELAEALLAPAH